MYIYVYIYIRNDDERLALKGDLFSLTRLRDDSAGELSECEFFLFFIFFFFAK